MEINARLLPAPLQRTLRHPAHRSDLGEREATEESEVYQLGQCGVHLGQLV